MGLAARHVEVDRDDVLILAVEVFLDRHVVRLHLRQGEQVRQARVQEGGDLALMRQSERRGRILQQSERVQLGADSPVGHAPVGARHRVDALEIGRPDQRGVREGLVLVIQIADAGRGAQGEIARLEARSAVGVDQDEADLVGVLHEREFRHRLAARRDGQVERALEEAQELAVHLTVRPVHGHLPIGHRVARRGASPSVIFLI